jgi:hypothetical protein
MNRIRHHFLRHGFAGRSAMMIVFAVLLFRALLSSAVMFDPDAPANSFGLVLCSGHGPLMLHDEAPGTGPDAMLSGMSGMMAMPDHALPGNAAGIMHTPTHSHSHADGSTADGDDNSICPFSAVFLSAICTLLVLPILFGLVTSPRVWVTRTLRAPVKRLSCRPPPSHAPPRFA